MTDWESGLARLGLFAGVMPRAIGAVRNAGHGDPASGVPAADCGARAVGETAIDEFFIAINSVIRGSVTSPITRGSRPAVRICSAAARMRRRRGSSAAA